MDISSLLRSPYSLGGAGIVGTGGLGVGSWQIYEESNPTVDRNLRKKGYSYSPATEAKEPKLNDSKIPWNSWGCVDRLFPKNQIKYDAISSPVAGTSSIPSINLTPSSDSGKFFTCAIMKMSAVSPTDAEAKFNNRIYFKSEVVIKGKDYGWVIWTGLSTFPSKPNGGKYVDEIEFVHRLLKLKKVNNEWKVEVGFGWDNLWAQSIHASKFIIAPPLDKNQWFYEKYDPEKKTMVPNPRKHTDTDYFLKKVWAGIGEIDENEQSKEKDLLKSISIYANETDGAELWSSDGEFNLSSAGYHYARHAYVDGKGWQYVSSGKNIDSTLKDWYKPFKNKKIRWTNLGAKCDSWSRMRNKPVTNEEEDLLNLCYQR